LKQKISIKKFNQLQCSCSVGWCGFPAHSPDPGTIKDDGLKETSRIIQIINQSFHSSHQIINSSLFNYHHINQYQQMSSMDVDVDALLERFLQHWTKQMDITKQVSHHSSSPHSSKHH
jgi:hypothetical protein